MIFLGKYDPIPVKTRQQVEFRKQRLRVRRDREIDTALGNQGRDLLRRTLVQLKVDVGITFMELADNIRQHVARLGAGRRYGQRAFLLGHQILPDTADIVDVAQYLASVCHNRRTGGRDGNQRFALARKYLYADFLLELPELLADTWLARIQAICGRRDIQAVVHDTEQVFQLN